MLWAILRFFADLTLLQVLTSTFIVLDGMLIHIRVRRLREERRETERRQAELRAAAAAQQREFELRQARLAGNAAA